MLCPHCGTENPDTSTICSNCNESLSDSTDSADNTESADGIDSTDGTDSPDSEVKHDDEDNDSGSEAEPDDGDNLNEQADSSTAEPDDPPVFSPPTMSPLSKKTLAVLFSGQVLRQTSTTHSST